MSRPTTPALRPHLQVDLSGQTALVTGAARGLGWVISEALLRCGARVVMLGPREPGSLPAGASWVAADVSNEAEVLAAFKRLDKLEILVNNAGIAGPSAPITEISREGFDETLAINLTGAFLCAREAARLMIPARRGRIINISSLAGVRAYSLRTPYSASKWGMIGLTRSLATELGPHNIQVNAICPGAVEGERMEAVIAKRAAASGQPEDAVRAMFANQAALKRFVRPSDVSDMVLFLASPAGENITGQALEVTAGAIL
jgi:NAD(P)-dependent dehydrogenase (short-subunit alcohol dehydrogenase family)